MNCVVCGEPSNDYLCADCQREEHLYYETHGNCFSCDEPIQEDTSCVCFPNEA